MVSTLATLRSPSRALFTSCVAVYPELVEGSQSLHRSVFMASASPSYLPIHRENQTTHFNFYISI